MTSRVLVATDLDPATAPVLAAAVAPFTAGSEELALCHVRWEPERYLASSEREAERRVLDEEARTKLEAWSRTFLPGRARELLVQTADVPFAGIEHAAEHWKADLVVVSASGASGLRRMLLGSVADRVLRNVHANVLVARPSPASSLVLAATDLSDPSFVAVTAAAEEARRRKGTFVVLHVVDGTAAPFYASERGAAVHERRASARSWVEHAIATTGGHGEVEILEGSPARHIVDCAATRGAELVVVAARGHTGLVRVLLGSVAEEVSRDAPCSVLVVRR
jgi:nucleotide-binding universal stress UspA family protein